MEIAPELRQTLAELHTHLERLYDDRPVGLLLYGSPARGDAEEGSDSDVLVVLEGPVEEIARTEVDVADLSLQHTVVVSCFFVSREEFETEDNSLLHNVCAEGVRV